MQMSLNGKQYRLEDFCLNLGKFEKIFSWIVKTHFIILSTEMNKANILPAAAAAELNEEHFWLTKANNKTGLWDCPRIMSYVLALCLLCLQSQQQAVAHTSQGKAKIPVHRTPFIDGFLNNLYYYIISTCSRNTSQWQLLWNALHLAIGW